MGSRHPERGCTLKPSLSNSLIPTNTTTTTTLSSLRCMGHKLLCVTSRIVSS